MKISRVGSNRRLEEWVAPPPSPPPSQSLYAYCLEFLARPQAQLILASCGEIRMQSRTKLKMYISGSKCNLLELRV